MSEVTLTGSGTVGDVASWSATEGSSPAVPGQSSAPVGSLTVTAAKTDESKFAVNNQMTFASSSAGETTATVNAVALTAASATLTGTSTLQRFNADFPIQPCQGGTMLAATDMLMQFSGSQYCTLTNPSGRYWSLQGHSAGFDVNNDVVQYSDTSTFVAEYNAGFAVWYVRPDLRIDGGLTASTFSWNGTRGQYYATSVRGNGVDLSVGSFPHVMFTFDPTVSARVVFAGGPDDSNISTGFYLTCEYNQPNDRLQISGYARVGGINTSISVNGSATGFSTINEMVLAICPRFTSSSELEIDMAVVSTTNLASVSTLSTTISTVEPDYFTPWSATGRVRGVYQASLASEGVSALVGATYQVSDRGYYAEPSDGGPATNRINEPFGGRTMNGWEYLNQVATARGCEISLSGSTVILRSRGSLAPLELPVEEVSGLQISSIAAGLSVDVVYRESEVIPFGVGPTDPMPPVTSGIVPTSAGIIYDAFDSNTTWTVEPGQVVKVRVALDSAVASFAVNPYPSKYWDDPASWLAAKGVSEFGTYIVSGSDNLPIPFQEWLDYGGAVTAAVSDDPRFLDVTFVGPQEIPGVATPYSFVVSDGSTNYPAFTVAGRGVSSIESTLNILTGASNTTVAVANTVDNIAISNIEQAHDVGSWAASFAAGTWQTISFSIPTLNLVSWDYTPPSTLVNKGAFGYSSGSLFRLGDAILRVDSVTLGEVSSTVSASYYTTVGDFDGVWSGSTVGDFDALWASYDVSDVKVSPLKT